MIPHAFQALDVATSQPAAPAAPPPEGIFPLHARHYVGTQNDYWNQSNAPIPAALRPADRQATDPTSIVRSVTGAVVAVSAAMRNLSAALEGVVHDPEAVDRAMAALNAAVADQALTARRVMYRFEDYDPL